MDYRKFEKTRFFRHFISTPFLWLPLPFILLLDLVAELYHRIAFPLCGIPYVKRKEYIQILDRNRLKYLRLREKPGCMYCGYANGFFLYAKEIAGRTEKYWCGIMHENKPGFRPHADQTQRNFAPFGDEQDFLNKYPKEK